MHRLIYKVKLHDAYEEVADVSNILLMLQCFKAIPYSKDALKLFMISTSEIKLITCSKISSSSLMLLIYFSNNYFNLSPT